MAKQACIDRHLLESLGYAFDWTKVVDKYGKPRCTLIITEKFYAQMLALNPNWVKELNSPLGIYHALINLYS